MYFRQIYLANNNNNLIVPFCDILKTYSIGYTYIHVQYVVMTYVQLSDVVVKVKATRNSIIKSTMDVGQCSLYRKATATYVPLYSNAFSMLLETPILFQKSQQQFNSVFLQILQKLLAKSCLLFFLGIRPANNDQTGDIF